MTAFAWVSMPFEVPVSCYLNVKSHFDIEQVLVFPKVACHLTLGVPQIVLQLPDAILKSDISNVFRPNQLEFIEISVRLGFSTLSTYKASRPSPHPTPPSPESDLFVLGWGPSTCSFS